MIRIWGGKSVANVQKVLWCLGELGLAFEFAGPTGTFPEAADSRYMASKAPGSVPVMDEDGFVLWEGNAIARYLAKKYATGTLWPSDIRGQADVERWMDYQLSTVREHIHPIIRADLDAAGVAHHAALLAATLDPLEAALADRPFLAGDAFTVADIPLGINVYRWYLMDVVRPPMPCVAAWYDRLKSRPAFVAAIVPPASAKVKLKVV
jgi:glutathione S-transferase